MNSAKRAANVGPAFHAPKSAITPLAAHPTRTNCRARSSLGASSTVCRKSRANCVYASAAKTSAKNPHSRWYTGDHVPGRKSVR